MTLYLSNRDGNGKTSEEGHYRFQTKVWYGSVIGFSSLLVQQRTTPSMSVKVLPGDFKIDTEDGYSYTGWSTSDLYVDIPTADPANSRITSIVLYVDRLAETSPSPVNNPNIVKVVAINGNPAASSPNPPGETTIESQIGVTNPYIVLADVTVGAGATSVVNSNISDKRQLVSVFANMVNSVSIQDQAITTQKIANNALVASKMPNGVITTDKFKPTIIDSNFSTTGTRWGTSSIGTFQIPNMSMNYVAGPTNETLFLWTQAMVDKTTADNAEVMLYVNNAEYGETAYVDSRSPWYHVNFLNVVNVNANSTTKLDIRVKNVGSSRVNVTSETQRWVPSIRGFSIYRN